MLALENRLEDLGREARVSCTGFGCWRHATCSPVEMRDQQLDMLMLTSEYSTLLVILMLFLTSPL